MFTISDNTPSAGCIQWSNLHMQYLGVTYTIQNGYTNYTYVYWSHSTPTQLVVSNTLPTNLTDADCLLFLNKSGTHLTVPTASILDGDLLVPGSIMANALAANSITSNAIAAGAVTANAISAGAITANALSANCIGASAIASGVITADKLVAGTITGDKIASQTITANNIVANTITAAQIAAGTITGTQIAAGSVTADKIKGGTLILGGSGNGNGSETIQDASGANLATLDNTGLNIFKGSIAIYDGATTSTNKIFTVDSSGRITMTKKYGSSNQYTFTMLLTTGSQTNSGAIVLSNNETSNALHETDISAGSIAIQSPDPNGTTTDLVIIDGRHIDIEEVDAQIITTNGIGNTSSGGYSQMGFAEDRIWTSLPIVPEAGFYTTNSSNLYAGQYTKIARMRVAGQYSDVAFTALVGSMCDGGNIYECAMLAVRLKQQAAMGQLPIVNIRVINGVGNFDAYAVLTQNDSSWTEIYVYLRDNCSYQVLNIYPQATFYNGGQIDFYSAQPFTSSLSGTIYYEDTSFYTDRLRGHTNGDQFSLGTGACRIDTVSGAMRLYTSAIGSADTGIKLYANGEFDLMCASGCNAYITGAGAIHGTSKSAITNTIDYGKVITYSDESPNHVFNDRGEGTLNASGQCIVSIDTIFMETVNTSKCNYHVQLTGIKTSDVYLDERQADYFVVKGDPGKNFMWTITVERLGFEGLRFNDADLDI